MSSELFVRSNVGRDILQCAAGFQTEKVVVWEYVTNGFEYVDAGVKPVVKVFLDNPRKRMVIQDNGRGMDWSGKDGLQNFFVMHGENIDRKQGRKTRGQFGTGKSAAFGIGDVLRITTVRSGKRCKVELTRQNIKEMSGTDPVPVTVLEKSVDTDEPNGTKIEIEGIHLKSLDVEGTKQFIERHLARLPRQITVFVNKQECHYAEPSYSVEQKFQPNELQQALLGDVTLTVRVAKAPLDEELRGVAILANGNWHATTLAGSEGREFTQYIFGFVDIPALDEDKSEIPPFDMSRSMRLNPNNRLVQHVLAFVSLGIESVRRELVEQDRKRKQTEEAKRLNKEGQRIAEILNRDFDAFRRMLAKTRAKARGGADVHDLTLEGGEDDSDLVFGQTEPAKLVAEAGGIGGGRQANGDGSTPPGANPLVDQPEQEAPDSTGKKAGGDGGAYKARGGFSVSFDCAGADGHRAFYQKEARTIVINLDHPQIATAKGSSGTDHPTFRRLAYEVAFAEYSVALQRELILRGEYIDMDEPVMQVRETLNRLARAAAPLYAAE